MVTECVKAYERETGLESISQAEIVNKLVDEIELKDQSGQTSLERAE